jgi:hypothetical protein
MLYPAIGGNRWCGPGALAILTGKDTDETARLLREVSGKRAIFGIQQRYMLDVLHREGLRALEIGQLAQTGPFRKFKGEACPGTYLVIITGHYVVIDTATMEVCDNMTVYPVPLAKYRRANKRVKRAWRIV